MAIEEHCEYLGFGGRRRSATIEAYTNRDPHITIVTSDTDTAITFMSREQFRNFLHMLHRFDDQLGD